MCEDGIVRLQTTEERTQLANVGEERPLHGGIRVREERADVVLDDRVKLGEPTIVVALADGGMLEPSNVAEYILVGLTAKDAPSKSWKLARPNMPSDRIASEISRNRLAVVANVGTQRAYVSRGKISGSSENGRVFGKTYSGKTSKFEGVRVLTSMSVCVKFRRAIERTGAASSCRSATRYGTRRSSRVSSVRYRFKASRISRARRTEAGRTQLRMLAQTRDRTINAGPSVSASRQCMLQARNSISCPHPQTPRQL